MPISATLQPSTRPITSRAPAPENQAERAGHTARLEGTDLVFYLYLITILVEYLGLASVIPGLKVTRFSTLMAWGLFAFTLSRIGSRAFSEFRQNRLMLAFVGFTALTVTYAVVNTTAFFAFRGHLDYFGLFVTTAYLVDRPSRVRMVAKVMSLVLIAAVVRNLDKLTAAVRVSGFSGAYFMGDGNDFAWAMNVLLPLPLLLVTTKGFAARLLGMGAMAAAGFAIVATQSRGAQLALAAAVLFYWVVVSKRKVLGLAVVAAGIVAVLAFAPSTYFDRMKSLSNVAEDNSTQGRLQAWGAAMQMAVTYPLGVGANNFSSAYGRYFLPSDENSHLNWGQRRWLSAHSVYFRVLGEYGVLGVIWLLTLLSMNFLDNLTSWRQLRAAGPAADLPVHWPLILNMSLIGYAVSGLFLGGLMYPHLYLLSALTVSATRQAFASVKAPAPSAVLAVQPAPTMTKALLARQAISALRSTHDTRSAAAIHAARWGIAGGGTDAVSEPGARRLPRPRVARGE